MVSVSVFADEYSPERIAKLKKEQELVADSKKYLRCAVGVPLVMGHPLPDDLVLNIPNYPAINHLMILAMAINVSSYKSYGDAANSYREGSEGVRELMDMMSPSKVNNPLIKKQVEDEVVECILTIKDLNKNGSKYLTISQNQLLDKIEMLRVVLKDKSNKD